MAVAFFEGKTGAPRTGIIDAVAFRIARGKADVLDLRLIQLKGGEPQTWNLNGTQRLPTSLAGSTVTFNGAAAALLYVSPTPINALVPATVRPGPVQVVVQINGVSSGPFTITATAVQPAIYAPLSADGTTFFVTAALQGIGFLVGNSTTDPRVVRAARPGDILDLYTIGLGATADPSQFITDQSFSSAYPVSTSVNATVGGETAQVLFAGHYPCSSAFICGRLDFHPCPGPKHAAASGITPLPIPATHSSQTASQYSTPSRPIPLLYPRKREVQL